MNNDSAAPALFQKALALHQIDNSPEAEKILRERYGFTSQQILPWETCSACEYPMVVTPEQSAGRCSECGDQSFGVCYLE